MRGLSRYRQGRLAILAPGSVHLWMEHCPGEQQFVRQVLSLLLEAFASLDAAFPFTCLTTL